MSAWMAKAGAFKVQTLQMDWFAQTLLFQQRAFIRARVCACRYAYLFVKQCTQVCNCIVETYVLADFLSVYLKYTDTRTHECGACKRTIGPFSRCSVRDPHSCAALEARRSEGLTQTASKQFPSTITHNRKVQVLPPRGEKSLQCTVIPLQNKKSYAAYLNIVLSSNLKGQFGHQKRRNNWKCNNLANPWNC